MKTYIMPDGNVYHKSTVTCVSFSSLTAYLGLADDEVDAVCDIGFSTVSWGDADYTLVNSDYALKCIINGLIAYYDELIDKAGGLDFSIPERTLTTEQMGIREEELRTKYWEIVERNDYIDLEG